MMTIAEKKRNLLPAYRAFEEAVAEMKTLAVCEMGCNFCCTQMGRIDITTLEGLVILERLEGMSGDIRDELRKKIGRNRSEKEQGLTSPCPFQDSEGACIFYDVRPFSCRHLYSLRKCDSGGPLLHRQAVDMAGKTVRKIQGIDESGYSGHLTFILHLLGLPDFRRIYVAGGFDPAMIAGFGKTHGITINRRVQ
jgi:hypothetical protein